MKLKDLINFHPKPIWRGNYNLDSFSIVFTDKTIFHWSVNEQKWLVFKEGDEIGEINDLGIKFIELRG